MGSNTPEPGFLLSPPGWRHRWPHKLAPRWSRRTSSAPVRTKETERGGGEAAARSAGRTRCPKSHLDELAEGGVRGVVGDEEPHVLVGDLYRSRPVHPSHRDNV